MAPAQLKDLAQRGIHLDISEAATSGPQFLKELMHIVKGAGGHLTISSTGAPSFLLEMAQIGGSSLTIKVS